MPKKVLVFLAAGFEEVEAVTPIDYLRRSGLDITAAALGTSKTVRGSHGIPLNADILLTELPPGASWDALVIPGGMPGAANIAASAEAGALIKAVFASGGLAAAICASPAVVLAPLGILENRRYTCYPGMETQVSPVQNPGARHTEDRVAVDRNLITSRGPGTAGEFAAAIVSLLLGGAEAEKLAQAVLLNR
jgi:4-methyl-5(b-hydroxyethyl)-thiazole monophosphate biosynthesis